MSNNQLLGVISFRLRVKIYVIKRIILRGGGRKIRWRLDQAQAVQAQYESFIINACGLILNVILKKAVDIKNLYGNSGNRFKKINTRYNFR